jgi:predicted acyltransferase
VNAGSNRLVSLDAFRGITIAGMILVNNPGNWNAVFQPLVHAEWNGCTFADLVFPSFLVILGIAMPFALSRRTRAASLRRIVRRASALLALGLLLNAAVAWPVLSAIRIPGVLQRIALVDLLAALIVLRTGPRGRVIAAAALLLGHWLVLTQLPLGASAYDLTRDGNLAAVIDRSIFGRHILTPYGDPEGLLGTVPATATALIGTLVGDWLRARPRTPSFGLAVCGAALVGAGWAWSYVLPMNKSLWTGSYALFAAGVAVLGLALFRAVLDGRDAPPQWVRPLLWLGMNPLVVYFGSELLRAGLDRPIAAAESTTTGASWLFWNVVRPAVPSMLDERFVAFAYGALVVAGWTAVAGALDRGGVQLHA